MKYIKLNTDWNADPNAPEVILTINGFSLTLSFFVNYFVFKNFTKEDKAKLVFNNCHKYSFNSMNDEGYFMKQYRYNNDILPYGEFYKIDTNWQNDFPLDNKILKPINDKSKLNHYLFFFRDNTFECIAENYTLEFIRE